MRKMKENDEDVVDEIDCQEVFDQIRHLNVRGVVCRTRSTR